MFVALGPGDHIAGDLIQTDKTTCDIEEPQQKYRLGTVNNRLLWVNSYSSWHCTSKYMYHRISLKSDKAIRIREFDTLKDHTVLESPLFLLILFSLIFTFAGPRSAIGRAPDS